MDRSKKAHFYLENSQHDLGYVLTKVKHLQDLNQKVLMLIEPTFQPFCQVANLQAGKLTLLVANGSIATALKFKISALLAQFKQDPVLASVQSIHCKVSPTLIAQQNKLPRSKPMQKLNEHTASLVQAISQSIGDAKLRQIMERIASRKR